MELFKNNFPFLNENSLWTYVESVPEQSLLSVLNKNVSLKPGCSMTDSGWAKCAKVMKTYFNPVYESTRYFFVRDGVIKNQVSLSYRIPDMTPPQDGQNLIKMMKKHCLDNNESLLLVHNHPGGIACPSDNDSRTTASLYSQLNTLSVRKLFIGHMIIGKDNYFFTDGKPCLSAGNEMIPLWNMIVRDRIIDRSVTSQSDESQILEQVFSNVRNRYSLPCFYSEVSPEDIGPFLQQSIESSGLNPKKYVAFVYDNSLCMLSGIRLMPKNALHKDHKKLDEMLQDDAKTCSASRCRIVYTGIADSVDVKLAYDFKKKYGSVVGTVYNTPAGFKHDHVSWNPKSKIFHSDRDIEYTLYIDDSVKEKHRMNAKMKEMPSREL